MPESKSGYKLAHDRHNLKCNFLIAQNFIHRQNRYYEISKNLTFVLKSSIEDSIIIKTNFLHRHKQSGKHDHHESTGSARGDC